MRTVGRGRRRDVLKKAKNTGKKIQNRSFPTSKHLKAGFSKRSQIYLVIRARRHLSLEQVSRGAQEVEFQSMCTRRTYGPRLVAVTTQVVSPFFPAIPILELYIPQRSTHAHTYKKLDLDRWKKVQLSADAILRFRLHTYSYVPYVYLESIKLTVPQFTYFLYS